eukprot:m.80486 g.80486  ORF g.80486 m.80486 type:complete len:447 (+) comp16293_c0_seq1:97-1437(+)
MWFRTRSHSKSAAEIESFVMYLSLFVLLPACGAMLSRAEAVSPKTCNVLDYGAKGDNRTEDTASIQKAIQACLSTSNGNTVVLPSPGVYLSRPISIPSFTTFIVEPGATLMAWPDIATWPNSTHENYCHTTPYEDPHPVSVLQKENFIFVGNTTFVTIMGGGTIDGQGWRWWPLRRLPGNDYWHNCRPKMVQGDNVTNFRMHNITIRNSPMYNIRLGLENASFTNITIDSNPGYGYDAAPNTDGFNIHGYNIYIGQSRVRNGDDCVPINPPSRNITVEDLSCTAGNGVVPIIFNTDNGTIEDVVFRRITLFKTELAITVKSLPSFLGTIRNILWEDILMDSVTSAGIDFNLYNQNSQVEVSGIAARVPLLMQVYNLTVRNVIGSNMAQAGKINCGTGIHACTALTLQNITLSDYGKPWECTNAYGTASGCIPVACVKAGDDRIPEP